MYSVKGYPLDLMSDRPNASALNISIRPFQRSDRDAFRELNEEWIGQHFRLEQQDHLVLGDPDTHIIQPGGHIFMACTGDKAVGCCALIPLTPEVFELGKMTVAQAYRGCGIGRRILEYTIMQARSLGAKSLYLGSNSLLADAIHLYESVGFTHRAPESIPPSPYVRANVFMELQL
jgi:putative acetyltransferase